MFSEEFAHRRSDAGTSGLFYFFFAIAPDGTIFCGTMALQDMIGQFLGGGEQGSGGAGSPSGSSGIPGGIIGGAAAGGVMGLVMGNKKARKAAGKVAGTAAAVGGVALLGGLAYKGYQNWKEKQSVAQAPVATPGDVQKAGTAFTPSETAARETLEIVLVKAMIAAAKADGHIDGEEQRRIFEAVERMDLPSDQKGLIFDCLQRDIPPAELASAVTSLEQKSEIYLASCLAIDIDHPTERAYLSQLASALGLPPGLPEHLERQAAQGMG